MSEIDETITAINSGRRVAATEALAVLSHIASENQKKIDAHDIRLTLVEEWKQRIIGGWKVACWVAGSLTAITGVAVWLFERFAG